MMKGCLARTTMQRYSGPSLKDGHWESIERSGDNTFAGSNIWSDGTDTYATSSTSDTRVITDDAVTSLSLPTIASGKNMYNKQGDICYCAGKTSSYKYNKSSKTFSEVANNYVTKTPSVNSSAFWHNGTTLYSTNCDGYQAQFSSDFKTITKKTFNEEINASSVWRDASGNTYGYKNGSGWRKLVNGSWTSVTFSGLSLTTSGIVYIWNDGTNTYYSANSTNYKLSGTTWSAVTFSGLTSFNGSYIWHYDGNTFYSAGTSHYKLSGTKWSAVTMTGYTNFYGNNVFEAFGSAYINDSSRGQLYYVYVSPFNSSIVEWRSSSNSGDYPTTVYSGSSLISTPKGKTILYYNKAYYAIYSATQSTLYWTKLTDNWSFTYDIYFYGQKMWAKTYNSYVYYLDYSQSGYRYEYSLFPGAINAWQAYNVSGAYPYGDNIWSDGTNIYYSNGSSHYKLSGTTWSSVSFSGLTSFIGANIWSDGVDVYCANGSNNYKLNGTTWELCNMDGQPSIMDGMYGTNVWTTADGIYYSSGSIQLKLVLTPDLKPAYLKTATGWEKQDAYEVIDGAWTQISRK